MSEPDLALSPERSHASPDARAVALCILGTAAFGAAAGMGHGVAAVVRGAWVAPAFFAGGAALAVPPLYLLTALSGGRSSSVDIARRTTRVLAGVALVLLGLAPAAAFFSVTIKTWLALGLLLTTVAVVGLVGVLAVAGDTLAHETRDTTRAAGFLWVLFALVLGARLITVLGHTAGLLDN